MSPQSISPSYCIRRDQFSAHLRRRSFGKEIVITVPFPNSLSTRIFPPCSSTTRFGKGQPKSHSIWLCREKRGQKFERGSLLQSLPHYRKWRSPPFPYPPEGPPSMSPDLSSRVSRVVASRLFQKICKRALNHQTLIDENTPFTSSKPLYLN